MKTYLFWVIYYFLDMVDSIANFPLSILGIRGKFAIAETYFTYINVKKHARLVNERDLAREEQSKNAFDALANLRYNLKVDLERGRKIQEEN